MERWRRREHQKEEKTGRIKKKRAEEDRKMENKGTSEGEEDG